MEMNFKNYIETYADMGDYLATHDISDLFKDKNNDLEIPSIIQTANKTINLLNKVDKYVGMKKMFLMLVPTTNVLLNSVEALSVLIKRPKKFSSWVALRNEALELIKLSAMNPLISAPTALLLTKLAGVGENQELIILATKLSSSVYFYLDSIVKLMEKSNIDKVQKMAVLLKNKVEKIMPKSEIPH